MRLRARLVLPISAPPIENAVLEIRHGRIATLGTSGRDQSSPSTVTDLGDVVVVPGFVNAHAHLEYPTLSTHLPRPIPFTAWVQTLLREKTHWNLATFRAAWSAGLRSLVRSGVTTVANTQTLREDFSSLTDSAAAAPRLSSFVELTGVLAQQTPETILGDALRWIDSATPRPSDTGLSPHAPYSTTGELLRQCVAAARERHWRLSIHVAESSDEWELFTQRSGPLAAWLEDYRDLRDCGHGTPLDFISRQGLLTPTTLLVHANYLNAEDILQLARTQPHVVHCPRSHAYFQHAPFPMETLLRHGLNIALGTDSLATLTSVEAVPPALDFGAELRALAQSHPSVPAATLLRMATRNGAAALGRSDQLGHLAVNTQADLVVFPYADSPKHAAEAVVHRLEPPSRVMRDGQWLVNAP